MDYIVTNFVYGTGPYLRTCELAIVINAELKKKGKEKMGIIVPWVYGEKQKRVMLEEFAEYDLENPGIILLDPHLGGILQKIFYGERSYEKALRAFVSQFDDLSREAHEHLSHEFDVFDLQGGKHTVNGQNIKLEVNRSPRIRFDVAPAYSVTFGYMSEILVNVSSESSGKIALDRALAKQALALAEEIEASHVFHALAHPGTFSYRTRTPRFADEILIPPTITPPVPNSEKMPEGIYVTITGIPGLERLYKEARALGLKLYSNDTKAVPGSEYLSPHYIPNPNIKLQFARAGWGSLWLSQLSGTPFVAPEFDSHDDPEIYFNNLCIEKHGLGTIYRGQPLAEILKESENLKLKIGKFNQELLGRFGTLDGNTFAAQKIVEQFVSS